MRDWPPRHGVFFSAAHVQRHAQVVALGVSVAENLFPPGVSPLGQYVLIGNSPFLVVGVMSAKGMVGRGDDLDNSVWLPYTTAGARVFGQRFFKRFVVRVNAEADMNVAQAELHALLMARHRKEDFKIKNMAEVVAVANETQNTLTYRCRACDGSRSRERSQEPGDRI